MAVEKKLEDLNINDTELSAASSAEAVSCRAAGFLTTLTKNRAEEYAYIVDATNLWTDSKAIKLSLDSQDVEVFQGCLRKEYQGIHQTCMIVDIFPNEEMWKRPTRECIPGKDFERLVVRKTTFSHAEKNFIQLLDAHCETYGLDFKNMFINIYINFSPCHQCWITIKEKLLPKGAKVQIRFAAIYTKSGDDASENRQRLTEFKNNPAVRLINSTDYDNIFMTQSVASSKTRLKSRNINHVQERCRSAQFGKINPSSFEQGLCFDN